MQRVLADTSVWIDFFRSGRSPQAQKLEGLLRDDRICIAQVIRAELLSGTRNENDYRHLADSLSAVPLLLEPQDQWDRIAHARFKLARRGIQASITDLSIAVLAEFHQCLLFTKDNTFSHIVQVVPLRFYT